jgi:hypothetical protein
MSYEIHLERLPERAEMAALLAKVFEVAADDVAVVEEHAHLPLTPRRLSCIYRERTGDFPLSLELIPDAGLVERTTEAMVARMLVEALDCRCIISDDSMNPFTWLMMEPGGLMYRVAVEPDALDRNELRVTRFVM